MAKINEIIRDMELLLSSPDQSNTPRGRQLAEMYAEICSDVNSSLAECRSLFRMGAYTEARKLNTRATPSFVDRYYILNFSRRNDWLRLCNLYNWSVPPELDSETVAQLENNEDETVELTIAELQDQWRRIIRDGSLREKLILARKIYALDPSSVWRSNLLNVERPWVNALKKEADEALEEGRAGDLAELYNELISPELLQKVPPSSLAKYQDLVTQNSREKIETEKKELLDEIAACYAAMLLPELGSALSRWNALESNPLFTCTQEERLQLNDARTFLLEQQAEANAKELFTSLQNQLEELLNTEADPKEIDRVYHSLQQLDRPIKPLLEERMNDLYARLALEAKRRHVRRCVYWGFSVALFAALIFTGIYLVQQEREFRNDSTKIRTLINNFQFETALEYCTEIAKERPSIAKRPGIVALRKEAEQKLAEARKMQETFDRACNDLETQYLNEKNVLDPVVEKLFAELEERAKMLPEAQNARRIALQQKYEDLKKSMFEKFATDFFKDTTEIQKKWLDFFQSFDSLTDAKANDRALELQAVSENLLNKHQSKIRKDLYEQWKNIFAGYSKRVEEKKKSRAESRARTRELFYPTSAETYVQSLENLENEPAELQKAFQKAISESQNVPTLNKSYRSETHLLKVVDQFQQDPYCRDIKAKATHPDRQSKWLDIRKKKLEELQNQTLKLHYNVFELVLTNGNTLYHFYLNDLENDLYIEKKWNNDSFKAFRLAFLQANNGVKANGVFEIVARKKQQRTPDKTAQLRFAPNQQFESLPADLFLPDNTFLNKPESLKRAPQYDVLDRCLNRIFSTSSSREVLLVLQAVAEDRTITNVYAKVHLLKQLYELLPTAELTIYQERLKGLSLLLDSYTTNSEMKRWQDPSATFKHAADVAAFPAKLNALNLKDEISTIILSEILLEKAVKYYPEALGVLYLEDNKTWRLREFPAYRNNILQIQTAFVLHDKNCTAFQPFRFIAGLQSAELPADLNGSLYNGQIVYLNHGLTTWGKEFQSAVHELEKLGLTLPQDTSHIVWPSIWPVNRRNSAELMNEK